MLINVTPNKFHSNQQNFPATARHKLCSLANSGLQRGRHVSILETDGISFSFSAADLTVSFQFRFRPKPRIRFLRSQKLQDVFIFPPQLLFLAYITRLFGFNY